MKNHFYPCLWFDGRASEAAKFYCSLFTDSRILSENQMVVLFELNGRKVMGLNGGPAFKFSEAVSLVIDCDTQEEIDHYWNALTADGGQEGHCGWLKDKFGVSWQVVPTILPKLFSDPEKHKRILPIFRSIRKFNIEELENA